MLLIALTFSYSRNRLHAPSIRALMCLGDWCRLNLFSDANLAAAIRSDSAATEKKKKAKEKEKDV